MILKYVVVLFNRYKSILYKHFFDNKCLSRIEHIDIEKQTIIVHTRGINTPLPIKFDALIKEEALLNSFSSRHASYIGYYYGVYSDRSAGNAGSLTNYFSCFAEKAS